MISTSNGIEQTVTSQLAGSVLIVDDDESMLLLLRRIFEKNGSQVLEANNGIAALKMFEQFHPDIVLLDVMMPGPNGFEVCQQLRALPGGNRTSIILVTSLNDEQAVERAFKVGADDYITKPLRWNVLRHRLRRLLITRRAEEQAYLQASLLQQVSNAITAIDRNGIITYWNQAAEKLFQRSADDAVGRPIQDIFPDSDEGRRDQHILASAIEAGFWEGELVVPSTDGQTVPIHITVASTRNSLGELTGYVSVSTDLTEQKRAEQALRQSETSFRHLFANNPHPMWVRDVQNLSFLDVNDAALAHYGYSREEFLTLPYTAIFPSEDVPTFLADLKTQPANKSISQQRRHQLKNGDIIDVDVQSHLLEFAGHDAILIVAEDITERKRTDEALLEERNLLRTLIDSVPDNIYVKDNQSRFVINNRTHLMSLGMVAQDDVIGRTDFDFFPQEQAERFFSDDQILIKTQEPLLNREELATNRFTNNVEWHNTTKAPLRDLNGQVIGLVGISHNITDFKKTQEVLTEERNLLHTLIDNLPDYIYVKDDQERFVLSNVAHNKAAGVSSQEDLIGKTAFDFFPSDLAAQYHLDDRVVLDTGVPLIDAERISIDSMGHKRSVLTNKVPLRDHNGSIVGFVGLSHDITERKQAAEVTLHLASIVESSDDAILGVSLDGVILSWNPGAERIFGYSREEAVDRHLSMLSPADRLDEVPPMFESVIQGEMIRHFETLRLRKDGKKIDVALSISPLRSSTGAITGFSAILRDITERKQTERALSEYRYELEMLVEQRTAELSTANQTLRQEIVERNWADTALRRGEEQLRRITDNMLDMIWQTDIKGVIQYASPSCWNVLGYTPDALIGHSIYERMDPLHLDAVMIALQTVGRVEYRYRDANGQYIWLESLSNLLFEDDSEAKGIILASRDITERKGTQGALQQSEERFRQLAENIDQVFWMSSVVDGQMIYISPAYERMWGRTCQSLYEQPDSLLEAIHPEDRVRISQAQDKLAQGTYDEEYRIVQPTGAIRWIHSKAFRIHNEAGDVYRVAGISEDVTERKRVEQELQELNRLKTDFLSTAAHELRTPLTSIRGFSEILLTRELDEPRRKRYLGLIDEQSTHLGQIIDDLLNLSRLEAKHSLSLNLEAMNMEELVAKVLPPFLESYANRPVEVEGFHDCPPILGDPFRISQVIRNLVSNAFKYSPNGGTLTVRGEMIPGYFQFSIQDTGIGMTVEQLSHLFEKFYRADASNLAISGTGLGLAISKLIVELHGGQIWAESEYHTGTLFCFTLPSGDNLLTSGE